VFETDTSQNAVNEELSTKIKHLESKLGVEETNPKQQKERVIELEKRIVSENTEKNTFKQQVDDITLELESARQKSKSENEKLQILYNEIKSDLEMKSHTFGERKEEFSNKVFECEEQVTNLLVELESTKTELKATKQTLEKEQKQVLNLAENVKNQNETFLEKKYCIGR
jgi:predicted  nucleic acid-binding Zn-ribbon protein